MIGGVKRIYRERRINRNIEKRVFSISLADGKHPLLKVDGISRFIIRKWKIVDSLW